MTKLVDFYRSPLYERALLKYAEVANSRAWRISSKLKLYEWGKGAFDSNLSDHQKRKSFDNIYEELRGYWQVFRNAGGGYWSAAETYDALTQNCHILSRKSGINLMTLKPESEQSQPILAALASLRDLKRTQGFPCMPVAKFTHFFNPTLLPIFDNEVVWKRILDGTFRADYKHWCAAQGRNPKADIDSARFNLNYTLMAADIMRGADANLMDFFSKWFKQQVSGENDACQVLEDTKTYYATAFEFVAIGAAHLEAENSARSDAKVSRHTTASAGASGIVREYKPQTSDLKSEQAVALSPKFDQALHYAVIIHAGQVRKGTTIPYLSHLLGVASIALEYGANEDEAIGALLHDAGEDAGGRGRIEDIRHRFGDAIADIVDGCTDADVVPKPDWHKRKEEYIAHMPAASPSVRLVSVADKLHNARAILRDYRLHGEDLWNRFNGGKDGTLWYYHSLVEAFSKADRNELVEELDRVVSEIMRISKAR